MYCEKTMGKCFSLDGGTSDPFAYIHNPCKTTRSPKVNTMYMKIRSYNFSLAFDQFHLLTFRLLVKLGIQIFLVLGAGIL